MRRCSLVSPSLFILTVIFVTTEAQSRQPCSVHWVSSNVDTTNFPQKAVKFSSTGHVVRWRKLTRTIAGHYDRSKSDTWALFSDSLNAVSRPSYDVLTNPSECDLYWVRWNHTNINLAVKADQNQVIARARASTGHFVIGGTSLGATLAAAVSPSAVEQFTSAQYYVLISASPNLKLRLTQLRMEHEPSDPSFEMMGMDTIRNDANVYVSQTIYHSRSVSESYAFESYVSLDLDLDIVGILCVFIVCAPAHVGLELGNENYFNQSGTFGGAAPLDIAVSRKITVPPYTSIEACSVFTMTDNFFTEVQGVASFSRTGYNATQVREQVERNPDWQGKEWKFNGDVASTDWAGTFTGSLAMKSRLIVTSEGNCLLLKNMIQKTKEEMDGGRRPNLWSEVEKVIHQLEAQTVRN